MDYGLNYQVSPEVGSLVVQLYPWLGLVVVLLLVLFFVLLVLWVLKLLFARYQIISPAYHKSVSVYSPALFGPRRQSKGAQEILAGIDNFYSSLGGCGPIAAGGRGCLVGTPLVVEIVFGTDGLITFMPVPQYLTDYIKRQFCPVSLLSN